MNVYMMMISLYKKFKIIIISVYKFIRVNGTYIHILFIYKINLHNFCKLHKII